MMLALENSDMMRTRAAPCEGGDKGGGGGMDGDELETDAPPPVLRNESGVAEDEVVGVVVTVVCVWLL